MLLRTRARIRDAAKPAGEAAVGALTIAMLRTTRYFDPIKTANLFGRIARSDRTRAARAKDRPRQSQCRFSRKSRLQEIETILAGVWDNLGRVGAEFAHLDHIWEHDPAHPEQSRIEIGPRTHELFAQLRLDGKPALIFASHLGNWELPALAAVAHGLDAAILYRRPNIASADRAIQQMRAVKMGTSHSGRPRRAAKACGGAAKRSARRHAGRSVSYQRRRGHILRPQDQSQSDAGAAAAAGRMPDPWRPDHSPARPSLSRRTIRGSAAGARRGGQIDVQGTMQAITSVVEGWIREYPEQWLWLHRRWR